MPGCGLSVGLVQDEYSPDVSASDLEASLVKICAVAEAMLSRCPAALRASLLERDVRIELCGSEAQRRSLAFEDGEGGVYDHVNRRVILAFYSEAQLCDSAGSLVHELGHAVLDALPAEMQEKVDDAFRAASVEGIYADLPGKGGYLMTNKDEYFACGCELFLRGGRQDLQLNCQELKSRDPQLAAVLVSAFGGP